VTRRSRASIHTSEVLTVESKNTGWEYQISIGLPASYDYKPEQTFPTIYVLDGNLLFEMVVGATRMMQLCGTLPEVLVVGIGYPLEGFYGDDFDQFFVRRAQDLTSVVDRQYEQFVRARFKMGNVEIETGGAAQFLKFLAEELVPMIEAEYRVSSMDRTLLGHSTGGHFALYTLFQQPQAFEKYVVGSPSLGYGERALFALENEYAAQHQDLPARLFLAIGEEEERPPFSPAGYIATIVSVSDFYRFAAILQERKYDGLKFTKKLFEGYDHCNVTGPLISAGLKNVFANEKE
jgi:hypothetical protein